MSNKDYSISRKGYTYNRPLTVLEGMLDLFSPFSVFSSEINRDSSQLSCLGSDRLGYAKGIFDSEISLNIKETDISYTVEASLAGYSKEDIDIKLSKGVLTITAEKKDEKNENDSFLLNEIQYSRVSRSVFLKNVDDSKVNAKYLNGILCIEIGKKENKVDSVNIQID